MKSHQRFCSKAINFLSRYLPFLQRKPYKDMQSYAGSMWWMMHMPAVNYILDFIKENPGYVAFHQYTFAADEVFFQSILLNAKDKHLSESIINADMRFIKWKDINSSHPENIDKTSMPEIMNTNALFARKFDAQRDAEVLDMIDTYRTTN